MKAQLNLEAVYKTIANPAVLLENSSFNGRGSRYIWKAVQSRT
jgi:hypothetical protein